MRMFVIPVRPNNARLVIRAAAEEVSLSVQSVWKIALFKHAQLSAGPKAVTVAWIRIVNNAKRNAENPMQLGLSFASTSV